MAKDRISNDPVLTPLEKVQVATLQTLKVPTFNGEDADVRVCPKLYYGSDCGGKVLVKTVELSCCWAIFYYMHILVTPFLFSACQYIHTLSQ